MTKHFSELRNMKHNHLKSLTKDEHHDALQTVTPKLDMLMKAVTNLKAIAAKYI